MNAKWYMLLILVLFFTEQSKAQYLSTRGHFEIDQKLGCHNLTVTVTNINPGICSSPPCPIAYKFEGLESPETSNPIHIYTAADTVWLYQFIQGPSGDRVDSIEVIIKFPELPDIALLSCNNRELLININDTYYDEYEINYGDGSPPIIIASGNSVPPYVYANLAQRSVTVTGLFTTATNRCGVSTELFTPTLTVLPAQFDSLIALDNATLKLNYQLPAHSVNKLEVSIGNNSNYQLFKNLAQNTVTDTVKNLAITQNTYCFRIATYDACSNFKSYSNEICSIDISTTPQNNQIIIDWRSYNFGAGQITDLYRDNLLNQSIASPLFQHIDSTVVCNTTYCYQAEISFVGGGISRSLEVCETAFSTDVPATIDNISSITTADSIFWNWAIPTNTTPSYYIAYQVNNEGIILSSDSVPSNNYTITLDNTVKYMAVEVHDICNNNSAIGNVGSNLFLEGKVAESLNIELSWNNYYGWIDGFQDYYIAIKNTHGDMVDSLATGGETTYTLPIADQIEQTLIFTVWTIPVVNGIEYSRSNILTFERDPVISIPNSFTPNGDGLNDKFIVSGKFIASYEMQIFNRWGEMLFYTTNLENGWDGLADSKKMPTGNYAFWMRVKDLNDNEHIRTGSILILSN